MTFDTSRLDFITDGDPTLRHELLQLFFDTVARCLPTLETSQFYNKPHWKEVAHELKGAANTLGFERIGSCCKTLENLTILQEIETTLHELTLAIAEIKTYQISQQEQ